jgi:hypothetical protein
MSDLLLDFGPLVLYIHLVWRSAAETLEAAHRRVNILMASEIRTMYSQKTVIRPEDSHRQRRSAVD